MPTFAFYLLKMVLCSAVLFGYYHLFLRNKVYHAYNRFYLLATVLISVMAPLLNFQYIPSEGDSSATPVQLLQVVNTGDEYLEEIILHSHQNFISLSQGLLFLYSLVSFGLLILLIKVLVQIVSILKTNSSKYIEDVVFVESNAKGTPFSFFKFIFWNKEIDLHSETGKQIFAHELAHVREKHSIDKLFLNIILIFCWINPVFWLIKKELNLIHEFIADRKAVVNNDASALAAMIVTSAYPRHSYLLTNHFFYSPIKRRLKMLSKYSTKKTGYFYRILALPVVLFLVAAFTIKARAGIESLTNPKKKITVVIDAGHGGMDAGASGLNGVTEKAVNLLLLKKIKEINTSGNIELVFTRENDIYQNPRLKAEFTKQAAADLFISIHTAVAPVDSSGMKVYISNDRYPNSNLSRLFSSAVINIFKTNYNLKVATNPVQRKVGIHVIQANNIPSILIDAGVISNSKDLAYLLSDAGQSAFAKNILSAIAQYANNKDFMDRAMNSEQQRISKPDTIPPTVMAKGTYNGHRIAKIEVSKDCEVVQLTLDNSQRITMSYNEALKQRIALPAVFNRFAKKERLSEVIVSNPKSPENHTRILIKEIAIDKGREEKAIDASEKVVIAGDKIVSADHYNGDARLRGTLPQLIGNNKPLYVVDGKEKPNAELNDINPNEIESIHVLKGQTAIQKYGAEKGRFGVIEILTKPNSGKELLIEKTSTDVKSRTNQIN